VKENALTITTGM